MRRYPEYRERIACLPLDPDRVSSLAAGGVARSVTVEIADTDRAPVRVTISPAQARDLASELWRLADRSERIAAGVPTGREHDGAWQ
jgi:ABC-type xylose transport system substrate-binding protein